MPIIIGILVIVILFFTFGHHGNKPAVTASPAPSIQMQIDHPSSDTDKITQAIKKSFKDNNIGDPTNIEMTDYDGGGYGVYIEYHGIANVKTSKTEMAQVYLAIHKTGENIRAASMYDYAAVTDSYGNSSWSPYLKTILDADAMSKINWSDGEGDLIYSILPGLMVATLDFSSQIH